MKRLIKVEFTRPAKGFNPISDLIRLADGTDFSHVRISWITSWGAPVIYEASRAGVVFLGEAGQKHSPVKICDSFEISITEEEYFELLKLCMHYAGVRYGNLQIIGMALNKLFRLGRNPLPDGESTMVCSEIAGLILFKILGLSIEIESDLISPKDIYKALDKIADIKDNFNVRRLKV